MFKRILAVILSISMILGLTAVFTVSAFAMEAPVFEIKKISSNSNRLVASINLTTGAFNAIDISFKTSGLKCVSIRDGSDLQSDAMTGCDTDPAIGVPNISIVSIDGYERQGEMYVVTFNILSDEYSFDLDITSCTITKDDGSNTDVTDSVAVVGAMNSTTISPYLQFYINDGKVSVEARGTDEISGKVTIPAVYNGYPVTRICDAAFMGCDQITEIVLPDSITFISDLAFSYCSNLKSINIPQNVTMVEQGVFDGCINLTNIDIADDATGIRADCGLRSTAYFKDESNWENGVLYIGKHLISTENCTLESYSVKEGTRDIIFARGNIKNLSIPSSVTSIACDYLDIFDTIKVDSKNTVYDSRDKCNALIDTATDTMIYAGRNAKIPNTVKNIGSGAFYCHNELKNIIIPQNIVNIGDGAFVNCENLITAYISDGVKNIGVDAFSMCDKLEDVYYQGSKEDWEKISIGDNNYDLLNATIHYNNEKTYTVEYNKTQNGGIGQTETRNLDKGEKVDLTLTAAKSGWDFIGWNTDPNAKTGLTSLSVENNNIVLYAIYKKDLTATFIDYSGTAKKTRTVGTTIYNNSTSGKINAPAQNSYTGWTKRGWAASTSPDANVTGTFSISSDTTYYGLYQKTLKLSYNANGGSNVPSSQSGTQYTNSYSISTYKNPTFTLANAISKQGSTFTGWALGSINGKIYGAGSKITINSNSTMYAAWKNTENIYNLGEETYSFSNFVDEDSYGHCFGMAVTSSGYYLGALNKSIIGGQETSSLYSFSDTAIVRKPICYYMNIQGAGPEQDSMVAGGSIDLHNTVNIKADWNSCVNYVKNHEHDNKGDLNVGMWFAGGNGGHAVNFLYYKEVNGQQRIYVYDNNFPETETYYYMGSDGYVYQAPLQTTDIKIVGIDLIDVNQYFVYAKNFNSRRYIYANKNEITVDGAKAYPMKCGIGQGQYTMYEIPENSTKVYIRPLVDNASFKYNDKIYSFNDVDSKTCGILTVPVKGDSSDQTIKFNIVNDPKVVKSILVSDITLNYKNSANIKLKITADEGAEYIVKYESSNPKVATVDENGKVYAAKRGEATITCIVTDSYGNTVSDTCKVTVNYTFWQWLIKIILFGWIWY